MLWPALLLTALALGVLAALYAVIPRGGTVDALRAQPLRAPTLAAIDPAAWQPVRPLRRMQVLEGGATSRWAVLRFDLDLVELPREPFAIFIPAYDSSLAAYVNGHFVGEAGSVTPPIAVNAYHPALFRLRNEDLRVGRNVVDLVVAQAIPGAGIVHVIHVGPAAGFERAWAWVTFASVDVLKIYNGLFLVLGAFALYVYLNLRRESVFLWFVLLIACCGLRNLDILLTQWPESQEMRALVVFGSSLGILLSCSGFINRLIDRRAAIDRWLLLCIPPMLLVFGWYSRIDLIRAIDAGYAVLRIVFAIVAPLMIWRLVTVARRLPNWRLGWMLGLLCMAIVFVAHDVVIMWAANALNYQYSLLASLPMISAFVVAVAQRYVESARELERSHATLEQRVRETESALSATYEQLRLLEREQALAEERQRIMRDMHDGVGGQLTGLVMTLRRGDGAASEVAQKVEASLNDLRLIIDSLDDVVASDLRTALGLFRRRIEPWLMEHGLELDWQADLPAVGGYGPRETLNLLRILQEACSNVVKHASARRVQIRAELCGSGDAARLRILVADDGVGLPATESMRHAGRGCDNMRRRARELGGQFEFGSPGRGCSLTLTLPLPPSVAQPPASTLSTQTALP